MYKVIESNFFLNYSIPTFSIMRNIIGNKHTNFILNKVAGEVFTSGETVESLINDIDKLQESGINVIGNYIVEGLQTMDE